MISRKSQIQTNIKKIIDLINNLNIDEKNNKN